MRAQGRSSAPSAMREAAIGHDAIGVDLEPDAEAGAIGAGPMRRVEAEAAGLELLDRGAVERAAVVLAEALLLEGAGVRRSHDDDALTEAQGRLDRIGESAGIGIGVVRAEGNALVIRAAHDEPIDHDLDGVALVLVERRRVLELEELAVDADADEALLAGRLEDPVALGLAVLDERAEDEDRAHRPAGPRSGRRSAAGSGGRSRGHTSGSADGRRGRRAGAGGRRSRSPCRPSSADCVTRPSGRSRWPGSGPRSDRRRASPSGPGTGARRRTGSRRSDAGPRRRWCRRRGCSCHSRTGR